MGRFGIDDTKYILTLQEAMVELHNHGKITPLTMEKLNRQQAEVIKILSKNPPEE